MCVCAFVCYFLSFTLPFLVKRNTNGKMGQDGHDRNRFFGCYMKIFNHTILLGAIRTTSPRVVRQVVGYKSVLKVVKHLSKHRSLGQL